MTTFESSVFQFPAIGVVRSCYKTKFGIPRQPGLIPEAKGEIQLLAPYNQINLVRGLEEFSHIWVLFVFHLSMREHWKATVRPPRLGGDTRVGVFSSRSPFRPNPIGLSVMKLDQIVSSKGRVSLMVSGLDIMDGSPVLDIKPYLPYADSLPDAAGGFAASAPDANVLDVIFPSEVEQQIRQWEEQEPGIRSLIRKVIAANPRPAYQNIPGKEYQVFLNERQVVFHCDDRGRAIVQGIFPMKGANGLPGERLNS